MSHLTHDLFEVPAEIDAEELREEINGKLIPEFEWGERWVPGFAVITTMLRRNGKHYFVQPFLLSGAGCSVPKGLPVRMRKDGHPLLIRIREYYAAYYRDLQLTPYKATEAAPSKNGKHKKAGAK